MELEFYSLLWRFWFLFKLRWEVVGRFSGGDKDLIYVLIVILIIVLRVWGSEDGEGGMEVWRGRGENEIGGEVTFIILVIVDDLD